MADKRPGCKAKAWTPVQKPEGAKSEEAEPEPGARVGGRGGASRAWASLQVGAELGLWEPLRLVR